MGESILQTNKDKCYICGRHGQLDKHHVFGGANRKKSEADGLFVWLCHHDCHIFGKNSVHQNAEVSNQLKALAQERYMTHKNASKIDFVKRYGKSYV